MYLLDPKQQMVFRSAPEDQATSRHTVHVPAYNFKWSVADTDAVLKAAKRGVTAVQLSNQLEGTRLQSTPEEILHLCLNAGQTIRMGARELVLKRGGQ